MSPTRLVLFALVTVLAAPSPALAQEDDLLAPLTPQTKSSRTKPGKTKVVKKKRVPAPKKPPRAKTSVRGAKGKKQQPQVAQPEEDDVLAPLAPAKTELVARITGGVRGAKLVVDGREVGQFSSSTLAVELPPGPHSVVVRKQGYADYSRRIEVKEGGPTEVAVSLEATHGFGMLSADVPGAMVYVDGKQVGPAPQSVLFEPGSREIEFRAPGFRPDVHNITVFAGKPYEVVGNLRPEEDTSIAMGDAPTNPDFKPGPTPASRPDPLAPAPEVREVSASKPWYGRWYVWAGVGAVVAAGTVGAVMATQGGAQPPLTAGDVCGGNCDAVISGARKGGGGIPLPAGAFRF
ncbi:MAG TPA: PEGA domain-containing protein [Myxococcus sp.]|nr:PEGA domain-containing protein [Myxococcus sp.]